MAGMKKKDIKDKLSDLFHGDLSPEEVEKITSGLHEADEADKEIELIGKINELIDKMPVEEPSSAMDTGFYEMLTDESRETLTTRTKSGRGRWLRSYPLYVTMRIAAGMVHVLMAGSENIFYRSGNKIIRRD
jgi:hypothetical protein